MYKWPPDKTTQRNCPGTLTNTHEVQFGFTLHVDPQHIPLQSGLIGQDTREDTRPFRGPHRHRSVTRHVSRGTGHKGTLELARSTY
eukprot:9468773-Pyramimonas_sp.AAC.1